LSFDSGEPGQHTRGPRLTGYRAKLAVLALLVSAGLGLWAAFAGPAGPVMQRFALSPQECNTECQAQQTDCILDCEGAVPCEKACLEAGKACLARCREHKLDAGVAPKKKPTKRK
jgi:hypothetical protein